jgi:hypothetical protein
MRWVFFYCFSDTPELGFRSTPFPYVPFTPVFLLMSDMWQLRISTAEIKKSQVMKAT